ncbi:hypothetical protein [Streptococcus oralis]|jgi:YD repeat protein|uniref:hypothetical protein n=1 Tax=Streptococcus oralis TaxID=1303 RepID=UPI000779AAF0|nr:hypothetical protein [Streptococcus oralis]
MGSATDNNLTPRPGKDTESGLSTSMDKPTGKCQAIDVSKLEKSGLEPLMIMEIMYSFGQLMTLVL